MEDTLHIGLCGWNGSQGAYFSAFDCIEIQSTFYDPPSVRVASRWRNAAPSDFQFCIKAWQLITHTAASPTYRRLRTPIPAGDRDAVGSFRQTEQVRAAWQRTLGFVSDEDLVTLYRCARALIAPSSYEGFGLPPLEAMALGTPVIAARASSLPEVGGDAAVYVAPDDDAALAVEIRRVLDDDAHHAALRAAALAQSRRFSWDDTARATLAAFDDAMTLAHTEATK